MPRQAPSAQPEPNVEEDDASPSKSQLKREMHALQNLGNQLVALSRAQLSKLGLPDTLFTAVLDAQRINSNSATKRQRQYIGRLMREVDPEPIQAYLDSLRGDNDRYTAWLHRLEQMRDKMMSDDKEIAQFIELHPETDIQLFRQHVRNARSERAAGKPPKHYRALFQMLKDAYPEPVIASVERADFAETTDPEIDDDVGD